MPAKIIHTEAKPKPVTVTPTAELAIRAPRSMAPPTHANEKQTGTDVFKCTIALFTH